MLNRHVQQSRIVNFTKSRAGPDAVTTSNTYSMLTGAAVLLVLKNRAVGLLDDY